MFKLNEQVRNNISENRYMVSSLQVSTSVQVTQSVRYAALAKSRSQQLRKN